MIVLGAITFAVMSFGVFAIRLPAPGWKPPSFTSGPVLEAGSGPRAPRIGTAAGRSVSERKEAAPDVHVNDAMRTPQFWLLWLTIAIAVTAGLGALSQAAPMFRETFPLIISPTEIASFGSLLGASGVIGALLWSVLAGSIGRQRAIALALSLGAVSMVFAGAIGDMAGIWPFITTYVVIAAAFGGVFATIPAYLRDTFGVMHVGAIHGRIITAWTLAGMTGGALAHLARESRIALGMRSSDAFEFTLYGLAGALIVGLIANSFIGPVHPTHHYRRPT
jgi:MFS family permease